MKILYYNPKNNRYQSGKVLSIDREAGLIHCLNVNANYPYTEKIADIKNYLTAPNPNWHGDKPKPLVKLVGFEL